MPLNVTARHNLAEDASLNAVVEALLSIRAVDDPDVFLKPPAITNDFVASTQSLFPEDLAVAVETIKSAIAGNEAIVIHGDYDVDGVSATAILWEALYYHLDYKDTVPFIPHRVDHGYGLSNASIDEIAQALEQKGLRPGLLITVDCGITSKKAVEYAKECGFTVIITDHHTRPEEPSELPSAAAILHSYDLCGAGIAWVLARSLTEGVVPEEGIDLVALATLSDIQPVTGFNRSLVKYGLHQLTDTKRIGLQALYHTADIYGKSIGTYEVGWVIGPRINATGRLEHALDALRLLVARNRGQALDIAGRLESLNTQRQKITYQAVAQAKELVDAQWNGTGPIIVAHEAWHEGVIGLIAARLVEEYKSPAIAISSSNGVAKGSARSISGINIVDLLKQAEEFMDGVGGHEMAAGFSVSPGRLDELMTYISGIGLEKELEDSRGRPLQADVAMPIDLVSHDLFENLERFDPYGVGNPRPVFLSRGATLTETRVVGKNKDHLQITCGDVRGIGFGIADRDELLQPEGLVDVLYTIDRDDFRGGNNVQIKVKDIAPSEE